uniref:uncharacterized protein LOC120341282 n=1 Tax=Styela clava TaxID=7725 RepID=UPI0019393B34|nr:uncharacterized protein LOC120341282 [Styela clava]
MTLMILMSFCNEKGFRSWRKLNPRIYKHEKIPGHRNAKREYLDFEARLEKLCVIDYELQSHISSEKGKWRLIVERIVDVVFLLSRQNIAFRSHRDERVSKLVNDNAYENNSGNFSEIIGLLADYDVVLFEHLQNARKNPNKVNYLSNKSQNELIKLIAGIIKKKIISEVEKAKYYTLMLDSTPDISREDQIAEILRYVHITFVSLLKFWCPILSSVQRVTKRLQDPKIDLIQASDDLDGLSRIIDLKSEDIIKNAVRSASEYCEEWNVPLTRVRRRKMMPGESVKDCGLSAIEEMQRIMNEIANRLKTVLSERSGRVSRLADKFSFLLKLDSIDGENIEHLKTLKRQCEIFSNHFETDVNSSSLYEEIVDCITLFRSGNRNFPKNAKDFLASLVGLDCDVFPTLCIGYRLLLTIGYSIASCE